MFEGEVQLILGDFLGNPFYTQIIVRVVILEKLHGAPAITYTCLGGPVGIPLCLCVDNP